jgi:hypothetical protein
VFHYLSIVVKSTSLEEQVKAWKERLLSMEIKAGISVNDEIVSEYEKWIDDEYVWNKLGFD